MGSGVLYTLRTGHSDHNKNASRLPSVVLQALKNSLGQHNIKKKKKIGKMPSSPSSISPLETQGSKEGEQTSSPQRRRLVVPKYKQRLDS